MIQRFQINVNPAQVLGDLRQSVSDFRKNAAAVSIPGTALLFAVGIDLNRASAQNGADFLIHAISPPLFGFAVRVIRNALLLNFPRAATAFIKGYMNLY